MKKFLAMTLAMIMAVSNAVSAFAVMDKGEIAKGDTIWFGGAAGAAQTKWKVVVDNGTDLILLSDVDINGILLDINRQKFDSRNSNEWSTSSLRTFLNSSGNSGFMTFFTSAEKATMLAVEDDKKVSIPTMAQVLNGGTWNMTQADRVRNGVLNGMWWLRDKDGSTTIGARTILANGTLGLGGYHVNSIMGTIPYINISLNDVLFAIPVNESTGVANANLTKIEKRAGDLKLVLKDNINQKIATATQSDKPMANLGAGDTITISYSGAGIYDNTTGASPGNTILGYTKAISCIITDDTGKMIYYGVLDTFENGHMYADTATASGTATLTLPADYDASKHNITLYAEAIYTNRMKTVPNYISNGVPLTYTPPPPSKYTLTIQDGGTGNYGTGKYYENDVVHIYAGTISDHTFIHWSQTTGAAVSATIADTVSDTTKATMPAGDVVVIANWTPPLPPTQYTLTVANGGTNSYGSGSYSENAVVNVSAGEKAGYTFDGWTVTVATTGITANVTDLSAVKTDVTMPASNITLTANWKADPVEPPDPPLPPPVDPEEPTAPEIYNLVVEGNGSVNSTGTGDYVEGETVHIYGGVREGYTFSHWTVSSSSKVDVADTKIDRTTVTMPANRVVMTANWIKNSTGGDITTTTEPETIPPMPQEPLAVEPPNTETSDMSSTGMAVGVLFVCGITCGILGGMSYKKYKQDKDNKNNH